MNSALLNGFEVNIDNAEAELSRQGYQRKEIKNQLNKRYRRFSPKGSFRCICCDNRVEMVLIENRAFHFRHSNKEDCSYNKNYQTYSSHVENYEDKPKHKIGKTIIRTYLEGTCRVNNANLMDGSRYKNKLSFVPDFIIEFPNGQRWAIDYVTGLKEDQKYANSIKRRLEVYENQQFIPVILFDSYWLAYEKEINYVSLVEGELFCVKDSIQDKVWSEFLEKLNPHLQNIFFNDDSYSSHVQSIVYINPLERELNIVRFLQDPLWPLKTRTVCSPLTLSFEKAFVINHLENDFTYYVDNEEDVRRELENQLLAIYEEQLKYRKAQEEERERKEEEREERRKNEEKRELSHINPEASVRNHYQMDRDLKRQLQYETKKKSAPYWYKQMADYMTRNDEKANGVAVYTESRIVLNQNISSLLPDWKQEEVLNHYINGEAYFSGESRQWKLIVLNSYTLVRKGEKSILELLREIQQHGIKTSQPEKIMVYPIKEYMEYLGRRLKKELG
ncbi:hypothetical protein LC085_17110 [Bacillus tianshenii]|uniref:hypothetical protein n=1 Tax=Sutcliffiella tianshenii TaxID=1463404 RepID=UPI001CD78D34|nr:hypothetical protein [Bacillus tianshenii]MCA1321628.1 hypothetical protein [Bacillus tianshenii]